MLLANGVQTQAGDIAFYQGHLGSLVDEAISLRTGSDLVHVAIFREPGETIAATSGGITRQASGGEHSIWRSDVALPTARLVAALDWLDAEVGKPYGYADIVNQVLLLTGKDPVLLDKSEDCSDLACRFLWIAGVALPASYITTNRVTPGGLFLALSNLP